MGYVVREGTPGDLGGGGKNKGNNWSKTNDKKMGFKLKDDQNIKEGKGGKKKNAEEKHRSR